MNTRTISPVSEVPTHRADKSSELLTLAEVALILRCSKAHLCNVLNGKVASLPSLPHVALGRRKLVRKVALEQWLERVEDSRE